MATTPTDDEIVVAVARLAPVTMRDLAGQVGMSLNGVSRRTRKLIDAGQLVRTSPGGPLLLGPSLAGERFHEVGMTVLVDRETGDVLRVRLAD